MVHKGECDQAGDFLGAGGSGPGGVPGIQRAARAGRLFDVVARQQDDRILHIRGRVRPVHRSVALEPSQASFLFSWCAVGSSQDALAR